MVIAELFRRCEFLFWGELRIFGGKFPPEMPRINTAGKLQMKSRSPKFPEILRLTDCSLQKTATGNGNLQPGIEINEYSSSKKFEYSRTRGNPSYQALYSARYLHSSRQSNLGYNLTLDELANVNAICAYPLLICTDASRTPC